MQHSTLFCQKCIFNFARTFYFFVMTRWRDGGRRDGRRRLLRANV